MMLPTHIVIGLVSFLPLLYMYPLYSTPIIVGVIIGSTFPDLDLLVGNHRKTLHYPVLGILFSAISLVVFLVSSNSITAFYFALFASIFIHSFLDIIGGSLEDEPWERNRNIVVYNHIKGRWFNAKRWIPYDGSPYDLLLFCILTGVLLINRSYIDNLLYIIGILSFIAVFYTIFRRTLFSPVYMSENYPQIMNVANKILGD